MKGNQIQQEPTTWVKLRNPGEIAVNIFIADFQVSTEANDSYN